jgi:fatty-acyl-CoA synthase
MTPNTITELYAYAADSGVDIFDGRGTSTAASILKRSDHVATALRDIGVRPGDRVAAWLENSNAYLSLHSACARLGAILVAINTRFGAAEIADITGRSGAKVLAVNGDLSELTNIDTNDLSNLTHLITVGICTQKPA